MASNIKIGHYTLLETLGVGSFGKVKRAVHSLTGHTVAIKIINKNKVANQDMFSRVKREIQYLKLLRHPHIIKLYEVISTPTSIYMVIEYAGGELFNYIVDKTKLAEDEARRFFQQIVCAVEYCHRHKIVHRDLKPENLLLDPSMNVKIADFGLSNIMTDGDFLKTSCGSPNYAAPEVISGKLYAGPEVDVWSCGVILYVMLCGRLPFDDDYIPLLFKKINGGIYSLPSFLSPETKYLLTSMLVVDPLKRITIAEIRQNAWFNVGLPDYLQPLPQGLSEDTFANLQEDIIAELMKKMNYSKETIVRALEERQNNQIKVAYQLVVDHKQMIQNAATMSPQKPFQSFLATSPPPWNMQEKDGSPNINNNNKSTPNSVSGAVPKNGMDESQASSIHDAVHSSIMVLSTSLPGNTLAKELHRKASLKNTKKDQTPAEKLHQQQLWQQHAGGENGATPFHQAAVVANTNVGGGIPTPVATSMSRVSTTGHGSPNAQAATVRRNKARPKWYFGIRSRSLPVEVMSEIYRALSNLGMLWKIISPYHIRAVYQHPDGLEVKIELQLYRLDNDNYLVDFKYVGQKAVDNFDDENLVKSNRPISTSSSTSNDSHTESLDSSHSRSFLASKNGSDFAMTGPQDIPLPGPTAAAAAAAAGGLTGTYSTAHELDLMDSPGGPLSSASSADQRESKRSNGGGSGPGVLSSTLQQEQQHLKEMREKRQEMQHHQRQREQKQRPTHLLFPRTTYQHVSAIHEVTSPFPFFDLCSRLITELAIGGS